MFDSPRERIAALKAEADRLQRILDSGSCAEGHSWKHIGGCNASCEERGENCACSIPVYECEVCGDCDYGDNAEARGIIEHCSNKH